MFMYKINLQSMLLFYEIFVILMLIPIRNKQKWRIPVRLGPLLLYK